MSFQGPAPQYCKAYYVRDLRRFPAFRTELPDDEIVMIHDDFTVTKGIFRGEDVLLDDVSDDWARFCQESLKFVVPAELQAQPADEPGGSGG